MAKDAQNFEAYAGDDASLVFTLTDEDGAALDTSGASLTWTLARKAGGTAVLTKTSASGDIVVSGTTTKIATVSIGGDDTTDLVGTYWHQLVVTDSAGEVSTLATGTLVANARS